jgi:hypothetical protein
MDMIFYTKGLALRITGLFTLRRLTAARGSVSLGRFAPTLNSTHIFASPGNLRFPLSGLQKRRKQPERYAKFFLKIYAKP